MQDGAERCTGHTSVHNSDANSLPEAAAAMSRHRPYGISRNDSRNWTWAEDLNFDSEEEES